VESRGQAANCGVHLIKIVAYILVHFHACALSPAAHLCEHLFWLARHLFGLAGLTPGEQP